MKQLFTTLLLLFLLQANALQIRNYDPVVHNRFSSGYPGSPIPNASPNFIAASFELSGIGWRTSDKDVSHTLITPQHFLGTVHNKPAIGSKIRFYNRAGNLKTYTIGAIFKMQEGNYESDLFVGELTAPILLSDSIKFYEVGNLPNESDYEAQYIVAYGKTARLGAGTIDQFGDFIIPKNETDTSLTRVFVFDYDKTSGDPDDAHGEAGDSGSPSFIISNDELVVVGVHSSLIDDENNNRLRTVDAFVPHYVGQINDSIAPTGYQVNMNFPVALITFIATVQKNFSVLLEWKTGSETNNYGFEIERGQPDDFGKISWQDIGFEAGGGTRTQAKNYQFVDKNPLPGLNYYRLQQLDFDGKTIPSFVVKAAIDIPQKTLRIFPNPVADVLHLVGETKKQPFQIYDNQGVLVAYGKSTTQLSVAHLPKGIYTLRISEDLLRFVKL